MDGEESDNDSSRDEDGNSDSLQENDSDGGSSQEHDSDGDSSQEHDSDGDCSQKGDNTAITWDDFDVSNSDVDDTVRPPAEKPDNDSGDENLNLIQSNVINEDKKAKNVSKQLGEFTGVGAPHSSGEFKILLGIHFLLLFCGQIWDKITHWFGLNNKMRPALS